MTKILKFKRHQNTVRSSWPAPDSKWKLISAERGDCLRPRTGSGESGAEEVATPAPGGGVDTPGWPWQRPCRSHRGPLATRVNSDDFSRRPCELTLLGETQEVGSEPWQCRGGLSVSYLLWREGGFVHDCVCSPTHAAANTPGLSVSSVFMKQILCPSWAADNSEQSLEQHSLLLHQEPNHFTDHPVMVKKKKNTHPLSVRNCLGFTRLWNCLKLTSRIKTTESYWVRKDQAPETPQFKRRSLPFGHDGAGASE